MKQKNENTTKLIVNDKINEHETVIDSYFPTVTNI